MADPTAFFVDFAVAAGIGGLIGVEREHRPDQQAVIAGIRTFPLISTAGFLVAFLARETYSPMLLAAGIVGIFALTLMMMQLRSTLGQTGLTTPTVMVVTFLLGILVGYDYVLQAVGVAVVATFLLVTKERLHRFASILDEGEILSTLQFITLAFILLPLTADLPPTLWGQAWLGRGAVVDPYVILLVVIFVSLISFASLVAMREVGPRRGMEFSGLLGGLVNSEATTASLAQRAKEEPSLARPAVVGAILATTTMLARNLAIIAFADRSFLLLRAMWPFLLPTALVGIAYALQLRAKKGPPIPAIRVKSPFAVGPALKFALLFAGISLLTAVARTQFGDAGVYVASLGGFVSAGAVCASLAGLVAGGAVPVEVALRTCLIAIAASVFGKLFIVRVVNPDLLRRAAVPFGAMTAAALVATAAAFLLV